MLQQTPSAKGPRRVIRTGRLAPTLALVCVAALGAVACDKVPLTAPVGTEITLVASTNVLPINGSTDLVAVLIEAEGGAGTPVHNGTLVNFTTSLGRIEPAEARTVNGRVTVVLRADGRSGIATVTAFSGSATNTLDVRIGAAAADRVSVIATPSSVPPNGGIATIIARVEDEDGNALAGVPVTFSTDAGTLTPHSAITNEAGIATTFLQTSTAATVTASAGGETGTTKVSVRTRSTVELTVPTTSVFAGAATAFTIRPGAVPLTNVEIDFGDGQSLELGAITSSTVVQHFYTDDGVFLVEVTGTDIEGGTAVASGSVAVIPISFTATASPSAAPVGTNILFRVEGIAAGVPIEKYVWDFGDGSTQSTSSASITHAYGSTGLKTATVTVHPFYGDARSASVQVLITPGGDH
jgi:PKD repeat protein